MVPSLHRYGVQIGKTELGLFAVVYMPPSRSKSTVRVEHARHHCTAAAWRRYQIERTNSCLALCDIARLCSCRISPVCDALLVLVIHLQTHRHQCHRLTGPRSHCLRRHLQEVGICQCDRRDQHLSLWLLLLLLPSLRCLIWSLLGVSGKGMALLTYWKIVVYEP